MQITSSLVIMNWDFIVLSLINFRTASILFDLKNLNLSKHFKRISTKHWPPVNWPPTDPLLTPLLTPYKINGRMKIKKCPKLSMWPNSSSSINLAYLKLARWRTLCRFPTLVLLLLVSGGFVDGKSTTEQDWISSNSAFVRIGKWSKEKRLQMNRLAKGSRWTARAEHARKPQPEDEFHNIVPNF